jgi:hypothetical protein
MMSNRLEHEFPEVTWRVMPPLGPCGVPAELMRECLRRGRQLRNQALRDGLRAGAAALLRGVVSLVAISRCGAQLWSGLPARGHGAGAALGA